MTPEKILERRCYRQWAKAKMKFRKADEAYKTAGLGWIRAHRDMTTALSNLLRARLALSEPKKGAKK